MPTIPSSSSDVALFSQDVSEKVIRPALVGDEAIDHLAALHTRILDALAGFKKMVEKTEPEFTQTA